MTLISVERLTGEQVSARVLPQPLLPRDGVLRGLRVSRCQRLWLCYCYIN